MDPMQQIEVRDLMMIEAKTNPKPINGRVHFHALLPLFVTILLSAYFLPGLRCYFCSVNISSAELANLVASKKALFLFSNFIILILLVIDFTLSGPSNSFTNTLHNDNSASLEGHLPSDSNAIVVGDAHAAEEQLHDDSLWTSSFLQVKELISLEQKGAISVDSFAEEKKSAKEESITNIDFFGDFSTGIIGDDIEWRPEYSNKSQQGRPTITAEGGPFSTLELVTMDDDSTIGGGGTKLEAFGVADELERLELDELNRKFDEFIRREKNKRRSEMLQLVMAV